MDGWGFTFRVNASVQGWKLLIGIDGPPLRNQVNVINCETTKIEDFVSKHTLVFSQRLVLIFPMKLSNLIKKHEILKLTL